MKPILSLLCDHRNAGLDSQLELFKQLSLSGFMLRRIGDKILSNSMNNSIYISTN